MPLGALFPSLPLGPRTYDYRHGDLPWDSYGANIYGGLYKKPKSSTLEVNEPGGSRNRKYLRRKMQGTWQEDPNFFEKFFRLKGAAWKHADAIRDAWYSEKEGRWKRVPVAPKNASSLVIPLRNLLNTILAMSEIPSSRRLFIKPNPGMMKTSQHPLLSPDLLLAGVGPAMTANPLGKLEAQYSCGLAPVRIMLESEFRHADRHLSAVHANEIFMEQDNRRFVYALILTETRLRVYMFDPSGAVAVPSLDYHARPRDFCAVIEGIASLDEVRAGFDTSICLDESSLPRIQTMEAAVGGRTRAVHYRVKSRLFRASKFVGRATCCWLVEPEGEPEKECVIKDAWIAVSETQSDLEGSLIRHANKKGVVRGLVRMRHEARIQVPGRAADTIVKNRRTRQNAFTNDYELVQDRVHTRIVMDTYGKPLEKFSNRRELLLAVHDAVQAHRGLLLVAGILHRDVSLGNILINPRGDEGDRGILIDLDFATYLDDVEGGSRGTFKYMSLELLQNRHARHTYLHDLESFYYVLCWIICEYKGPGDAEALDVVSPAPEALLDWKSKSYTVAGAAKRKHIEDDFDLPVQPWFGETIRTLMMQLHGFFQRRNILGHRTAPRSAHSEQDYAEFLGYFQCAIDALPSEDDIQPPGRPSPAPQEPEPEPSNHRKRKARDFVEPFKEPRPKRADRKSVDKAPSVAVCRPRRSKANYRQNPAPSRPRRR